MYCTEQWPLTMAQHSFIEHGLVIVSVLCQLAGKTAIVMEHREPVNTSVTLS